MAKQRGLHQIKGKVGEYSYYSQTGVSGGLIRKINEGLSARVKTDAAYANTRLNNQEFGSAADTAALLGKTVVPKFRPMILPFSQAKMAKEVLKVAREHTANWGQRVVTSADTDRLCAILSSISKRDPAEFVSVSVERGDAVLATVRASYTDEQATLMNSLGITEISVSASIYNIATGQWVPLAQMMSTGYIERPGFGYLWDGDTVAPATGATTSEDLDAPAFVPATNHAGHQICVIVIMPQRTIGSTISILQEYCSFVALPVPENE